MMDLMRKYFQVGLGAMALTKEKAEQIFSEAVKKGEVTAAEAKQMIEDMLRKGEQQREEIQKTISNEIERFRHEFSWASKKDFEQLEARVAALEAKVNEKTSE